MGYSVCVSKGRPGGEGKGHGASTYMQVCVWVKRARSVCVCENAGRPRKAEVGVCAYECREAGKRVKDICMCVSTGRSGGKGTLCVHAGKKGMG